VPNVVEVRDGSKLYIVADDVMVRILLDERAKRKNFPWGSFIQSPATIYSFDPSLISKTLDTYLSRIMIDSLMMAF
jgi:hypothetical protein